MKWNFKSLIELTKVNLSWSKRFFLIVLTHFLINIVTRLIFLFDDFSLLNQITHSIIHILFLGLVIKIIYLPRQEELLKKKKEKWWIWGFVILNAIPFYHDFKLADNGFVPMWAIAPSTNFGVPNIYLFWFSTEDQYTLGLVNNPLIHLDVLFLNLYLFGIFTIFILHMKRKIIEKIKRTDNNVYKS